MGSLNSTWSRRRRWCVSLVAIAWCLAAGYSVLGPRNGAVSTVSAAQAGIGGMGTDEAQDEKQRAQRQHAQDDDLVDLVGLLMHLVCMRQFVRLRLHERAGDGR